MREQKFTRALLGAKKSEFWRLGSAIMHTKRGPNARPNEGKTTQNQEFIVYGKEHQFWLRFGAPKRRFWESKANTFEHVWEQKHEREPIFDF